MKKIGIICEYNPFHNGHIYHINKIKETFKDSMIIAVMSGNFTQRGIPSILSKNEKTTIALNNNIDLVVELPTIYATQGADIFAYGAVSILNELKVDYLVFGSESNDIKKLEDIAEFQLKNSTYHEKVKNYLKEGFNYPTAMAKALENNNISTPNDLLGLSYIKAIKILNSNIIPLTIKRTNDFHSKDLDDVISSATAIREAISNKNDIKKYVPAEVLNILKEKKEIDFFHFLKYKIITEGPNIKKYLTVDEGIENRIIKVIKDCNSLDELIKKIKTKRYTYNKLSRMFIHILCSITKDDAIENKEISYIRILGFNPTGQQHLNKIKKELIVPLIVTEKYYKELLKDQIRIDNIYDLISKK